MSGNSKFCIFVATALSMSVPPSYANPIASPALGQIVQASGPVTFGVTSFGTQTCTWSMTGSVTTVGTSTVPGVVTFTTGSLSGPGCVSPSFSITYPVVLRTISLATVRVDQLKINTPLGTCTKNNFVWLFNNSARVITIPGTAFAICTIVGTMDTNLIIAP